MNSVRAIERGHNVAYSGSGCSEWESGGNVFGYVMQSSPRGDSHICSHTARHSIPSQLSAFCRVHINAHIRGILEHNASLDPPIRIHRSQTVHRGWVAAIRASRYHLGAHPGKSNTSPKAHELSSELRASTQPWCLWLIAPRSAICTSTPGGHGEATSISMSIARHVSDQDDGFLTKGCGTP